MALFIGRLFLPGRPTEPRAAEFVTALKFSLLPGFVMAGLVGTTPDFGVATGAVFGLITSLASAKPLPTAKARISGSAESAIPNSSVPGSQ